ncbi:MAG: JmjC domain-containing protein, partial [Geminicoccaceae bacterium]
MEPGDLLYLPRGQYHDALADEGGAVHIAFGVTYPIGMDVMSHLFEKVIARDAFRANLPRVDTEGQDRLDERLADLAEDIRSVLTDPKTRAEIVNLQKSFAYPRHSYDLDKLLRAPVDPSYKVHNQNIRLVEQGGRYGLVQDGSRNAIEVPSDVSELVGWVLERQQFSRKELATAFPRCQDAMLDKLIKDLGSMRLTELL